MYEPLASSDGLHEFCLSRGLMITDDERNTSGPARGRAIGAAAVAVASKLTSGRFPASHDEITMVIRKPQHHFARLI
ncbi:hypothetical protein ACFQYP_59555 [Nonomuraea antimicrobica]